MREGDREVATANHHEDRLEAYPTRQARPVPFIFGSADPVKLREAANLTTRGISGY